MTEAEDQAIEDHKQAVADDEERQRLADLEWEEAQWGPDDD